MTRWTRAAHLDITCPDERRLALEVPGVDDVLLSGVQDELGQVHLAPVDGVEQRRASGRQPLAVEAVGEVVRGPRAARGARRHLQGRLQAPGGGGEREGGVNWGQQGWIEYQNHSGAPGTREGSLYAIRWRWSTNAPLPEGLTTNILRELAFLGSNSSGFQALLPIQWYRRNVKR